ncbi:MAG: glycosyltransferase family 87 protein [Planctomycetota bacterium]
MTLRDHAALTPKPALARGATIAFWLLFAGLAAWGVFRHSIGLPDGLDARGDWGMFYVAGSAVWEGVSVVDATGGLYIYPPMFAILISPICAIGPGVAGAIYQVLMCGAMAVALWWGSAVVVRDFRGKLDTATRPVVAMIAAAVVFKPMLKCVQLGQTDPWLALGIVGMLAWSATRPMLAGLLLALTAHVKYTTLALLPVLMWRGYWRLAGATLASVGGVFLIGAALLGWEENLRATFASVGVLGELVGIIDDAPNFVHPITFDRSIAIPSMIARTLPTVDGEPNIQGALAIGGGLALLCLLVGWGMYAKAGVALWRVGNRAGKRVGRRGAEDGGEHDRLGRGLGRGVAAAPMLWLEVSGVVAAVLAFGAQTTTRHTALMVPLALVAAQLLVLPGSPRLRTLLASLAIAVAVGPPREAGGPIAAILGMLFVALWLGLGRVRSFTERPA